MLARMIFRLPSGFCASFGTGKYDCTWLRTFTAFNDEIVGIIYLNSTVVITFNMNDICVFKNSAGNHIQRKVGGLVKFLCRTRQI